jgi:hypothetical protein
MPPLAGSAAGEDEMDGVAAIRSAFAGAHNWFMGTVAGVTAETANLVPPGVVQPIGALMAHIAHSEDFLVNALVRQQRPLWEREGWAAKVGGPMLLDQDQEAIRAYSCDPAAIARYAEAVFAGTDAALASLAEADLEREANLVQFGFPANMPLGAFLTQMLLGNTYAHTGEISALKGLQSLKGYPF